MKTRTLLFGALLAVLHGASALAADPAATVRAFAQALQQGKSAEAVAMISPEAGYAYSLDGALTTGDRFKGWLQSDIVGPGSTFVIEAETVTGTTVDTLVMWGRGTPSTPARYVFEVKDGLITSWRMTRR